jgi:hypothetical protein
MKGEIFSRPFYLKIRAENPDSIGTASCLGREFLDRKTNGAEDGIRTRDFLLGKEAFYH